MSDKELIQATENYSDWLMSDCSMPLSEIEWLVESLLASDQRDDIVELLKTFK